MNGPRFEGKGYSLGSVNGHQTSEGKANAALVVAAPDLLAALQACLPFVDKVRAMSGGDGDLAAANARNAIAKAITV